MNVRKIRENKTHQIYQVVVAIVVVKFNNKLVQLGHLNCDDCWNTSIVCFFFITGRRRIRRGIWWRQCWRPVVVIACAAFPAIASAARRVSRTSRARDCSAGFGAGAALRLIRHAVFITRLVCIIRRVQFFSPCRCRFQAAIFAQFVHQYRERIQEKGEQDEIGNRQPREPRSRCDGVGGFIVVVCVGQTFVIAIVVVAHFRA